MPSTVHLRMRKIDKIFEPRVALLTSRAHEPVSIPSLVFLSLPLFLGTALKDGRRGEGL